MRATDFFNEDQFGTEPKRPARAGSRPARGSSATPRYKSAPVVPGGDNPDAPHKPNKGDEPVHRGDHVLVQDPDNIATVHSGVVKRIGREFVYVTLKNGETVAAPHDEVSKNYEVLSKRAHLILNKKGPSRSNYKVDESSEKLTWSNLSNSLSVEEKLTIFEEYFSNGDLTESNDEDAVKYFNSLSKFSDQLVQGQRYIVVPLILVKNRVSLLDNPQQLTYISSQGKSHTFQGESGSKEYPSKQIRDISTFETFTFATQASYNKFKTALALKFDVELPAINRTVAETKKLTSREKFLRGLKRGGYDVEKSAAYWDAKVKELERQRDEYEKELASRKQHDVAEGIFDIFKKLPAPGSTIKIAGRPVEITHAGVGSDYIGYAWKDKKGKEHYEETPAEEHDNLRSLAKTIAAEIKYADDDGVDDELDAQIKGRLDRHFGDQDVEECAGVGIVTKQNSTADVGPGTIKKNLKAFNLAQEGHDDDEYVQQLTTEFIRRAKLGRRYTPAETILGMLDRFFKKFAISDRYFDDVYHRVVRTTDHEAGILEMETDLEEWKASRQLCRSSTPDSELGASALASCKSQGLRARDGKKSHKVGNKRITVGGHRIKGKKYGGPLPDYGTRK